MNLRDELHLQLSKLFPDDKINDCKQAQFIESSQQDIITLLKRLHEYLESTKEVEKSLTELPDTGQFLGRLCGSHAVRCNQPLYKAVMMCVMSLYRVKPSSPLEQKAKDWALAQLHSTVKTKPKDAFAVCCLGISHSKVTQDFLYKMSTQVLPALKRRIGGVRVRCAGSGAHIPEEVSRQATDTVRQVMDILLSVSRSDAYQDMWTDIVWVMSVLGADDPSVLAMYQRIVSVQNTDHGDTLTLSKAGYKLLWQSYLPSLEAEVLGVIDEACGVCLPSSVKNIFQRHYLPEVCCEDPHLLLVVSQMLHKLISNTGDRLLWVVSVFYQTVQAHCHHSMSPLTMMYPEGWYLVSAELTRCPAGTGVDGWAAGVCRIAQRVEELQQGDNRVALHHGMLYHRHWYLMTVQVCLHCHRKFIDGCSSLLSQLLEPTSRINQAEIKEKLSMCILALRSLMNKVNLEYTDILYVIQTDTQTSDVTRIAIGHLVMMFLYSANAGMRVFKKVLNQVSGVESAKDSLVYMFVAHEELDVTIKDWSPYRRKEYCDLVQDYLTSTQSDKTSIHDNDFQEIVTAATKFLKNKC